jgi:beta-1,4-N-acetylglucosaminyltransferase
VVSLGMLFLTIAVLLSTILSAFLRLLWILPVVHKTPLPANRKGKNVLVFLGSGGHTAEMLVLLRNPPEMNVTWMYSQGDELSKNKALAAMPNSKAVAITRARKIRQSWYTTPITSIHSFLSALLPILQLQPDLALLNGPGTAVIIVLCLYILKFWGLKATRITYIESFARVDSLSLSGRLLLFFVDRFLVQWRALLKYPRAEFVGVLV